MVQTKINLNNITVILHQPITPENIGATARAVCNMGITRLIVVNPREWDLKRIEMMATPGGASVVSAIQIIDTLEEALGPFQYVVGTTARAGSNRPVKNPRKMAEALISVSHQNHVALLFGPENRGLTNAELRLCHEMVRIPTARFSSLNLAQAVMILCYELFLASQEPTVSFAPCLANHHELEGMYDQLQSTFVNINFINPDNPEYWMGHVRRFFARIGLRAREVKMIRGICRQIEWYGSRNR